MNTTNTFAGKLGIPPSLLYGYLGILVFMMGDGMEVGWLSPYLVDRGMSIQQTASLFSVYGITIVFSSWFSGVFAQSFGPKKTMAAGLLLYLLGTVGFIAFGVVELNYGVMLATYAIRGY